MHRQFMLQRKLIYNLLVRQIKNGPCRVSGKQANAKTAAARNRGITEANGAYSQFIDSDDKLKPNRLERLANEFLRTGADYLQTGFEGDDPLSGAIVQRIYGNPDENQVHLALEGRLRGNTLCGAI
jgi:glycosyltransferase involved in cell wall biosynthesis